jgi:hypothetical protein
LVIAYRLLVIADPERQRTTNVRSGLRRLDAVPLKRERRSSTRRTTQPAQTPATPRDDGLPPTTIPNSK